MNTNDVIAKSAKTCIIDIITTRHTKEIMFTFACASIEGLTLNQKRETLKALRIAIKQDLASRKFARLVNSEAKAQARADKVTASIARAEARLQKLLAKQVGAVGSKALKANRKPSKVVTYGAEANEIAAAIMAKKQSA